MMLELTLNLIKFCERCLMKRLLTKTPLTSSFYGAHSVPGSLSIFTVFIISTIGA